MKTITIIPAYNEEKTIRMVVKEAKRHVDEVVVVYDKSGDKTLEEIQDLCDIITIKRRRGKGYALRLGFVYALKKKYDIIVMIDADGEKDPREIGKLIEYLKNEYADMVVGTRDSFRSKWRKTFNLFTSWWINLATGYNLTDVSSGFNVYHYLSLKKMSLKSNSFEIEIEIILEAKKNNLKVIGHPISSPYISRSKLGFRHAIEINNFFDKWILINYQYLNLKWYKTSFLLISVICGYIIGTMLKHITVIIQNLNGDELGIRNH